MRTLAVVLLILLLGVTAAFSQKHYGKCVRAINTGIKSDVLVNSAGEVCLRSEKIEKLDNNGDLIWEQPSVGNIKFQFKDDGTAYNYGFDYDAQSFVFSKYFSSDGHQWKYVSPMTLDDFAVDNSGNIFFVESEVNPSDPYRYRIFLTKYNSDGDMQWGPIEITALGSFYSDPRVATNDYGEVFVSYLEPYDIGAITLRNVKVASFDGQGSPIGNELVATEDGEFFDEVKTTIYPTPLGDVFLVTSYKFYDARRFRSDIHRISRQTGISIQSEQLKFNEDPKVRIESTRIFLGGLEDLPQSPDPNDPYIEPRYYVIEKRQSDLGTIRKTDLGIMGGYSVISLNIKNNAIYASRGTTNGYAFRIDKYVDGNLIPQFYQPVSYYSQADGAGTFAVDYQNHYWAISEGCLLKIIPCSEFDLSITQQPVAVESCPGNQVSMSVLASGTEVEYYWYKENVLLSENPKFEGIRSSTLVIKQTGWEDQGSYHCEVRDACDRSVLSTIVTLKITGSPVIVTQPQAVVVQCSGGEAIFEIAITGGKNVKYQWKKGNTIINDDARRTGTKTNKLQVKLLQFGDAGDFHCVVTADCTQPITSQTATLNVKSPTAISNHPPPTITACRLSSSTLSVIAAGAGLQYQWKKNGQNVTVSARVTGATTNTLVFTSLESIDAGQYVCVVSGDCGAAVTSNSTTVTINDIAQITQQPQSVDICNGTTTSLSVNVTGPNISYQWMKGNVTLANDAKFSGVSTSKITITGASASDEGFYTCRLTTTCNQIISNVATINIGVNASITSQTGDLTLCTGSLAKLSVTATGEKLSYRWKKDGIILSDNNSTAGATSSDLYIENVNSSNIGTYLCEVSSTCGSPRISNPIKIGVSNAAIISAQPLAQGICEESDLTLEVDAENVIKYEWMFNGKSISNGSNVTGAESSQLKIAGISLSHEGTYSCKVTGCGGDVISKGAKILVYPKPKLTLVLNCDDYFVNPGWQSLVTDERNTYGEYFIYKQGSDEPLPDLGYITEAGAYIIVKQTEFCSDELAWDNQCEATITSIEDPANVQLIVAPNPTNRWLNLKYDPLVAQSFMVFDSHGTKVSSSDLGGAGEFLIDGDQWASGVYLLMVRGKNGHITSKRVVLEH